MKINLEKIQQKGKLHFLIMETWQGMDPTANYQEQAQAIRRAMDSVQYIEQAFDQGTVVLMHKEADQATTIQMVAVDNLEQLDSYIKGNEAHARLRPENRRVIPLCDWESGKAVFEKTIAKAEIRASFEQEGKAQPSQVELNKLAEGRRKT